MSLRPLNKRIVVKPTTQDSYQIGGVTIPTASTGATKKGTIIDSGECNKVSNGVVVVFESGSGVSLEVAGEEVIILKEEELLGVLSD